jgi:hypothetical protein
VEFAIRMNQAAVSVSLAEQDSAAASLTRAVACCQLLDYPIGWHEIHHLEGNLSELVGDVVAAETSYLEAFEGFLSANEPRPAVLLALDLAMLDSRQGRTDRAEDLARWSIPILQSMKLYEETVAAIELLARESAARRIDQQRLAEVARLLRLDPLLGLGQGTRAGRMSRPSCLSC